jgi:hypothetical protein
MLVRRGNAAWHEPAQSGYANERHLQQVLSEHPSLIPGVGLHALVCAEFPIDNLSADLVVLDDEGGLTLVECKLAANPQARREIIGQVLDYASRLWQMSIADFESRWGHRNQRPLFGDDNDAGALRQRLSDSLASGEFRIVLAVDEINDDLRRIVEYLNTVTLPSVAVIAVVYSRVQDGEFEILTPQSYGGELAEAKKQRAEARRGRWSIESYRDWLVDNDPAGLGVFDAFVAALDASGFILTGGRATTPSFNARVTIPAVGAKWPLIFYTYANGAAFEVRFEDFKQNRDAAERFLRAVDQVPALGIDPADVRARGFARRPTVYLHDLSATDVEDFVASLSREFGLTPNP